MSKKKNSTLKIKEVARLFQILRRYYGPDGVCWDLIETIFVTQEESRTEEMDYVLLTMPPRDDSE